MDGKVKKNFVLEYELDVLEKKIKVNEKPETPLKDFLKELKASGDFLSKALYKDIIDTALTEMRVMAWTGMDIKEWLNSVGYENDNDQNVKSKQQKV
ncbi:MAG: hypothetical protein N2Z58_07040 [Fervidobacterium sp.]|nr:hypothetical protein [Fervidobacterium sp.]